jgi:hypothetical protein
MVSAVDVPNHATKRKNIMAATKKAATKPEGTKAVMAALKKSIEKASQDPAVKAHDAKQAAKKSLPKKLAEKKAKAVVVTKPDHIVVAKGTLVTPPVEPTKPASSVSSFGMKVYLNTERRSFLQISAGKKWDHYLTIVDGELKAIKLTKEKSNELHLEHVEPSSSPQHFANVFLKSTLTKSPRVKALLEQIALGFNVNVVAESLEAPESDAVLPGEKKGKTKKEAAPKKDNSDMLPLKSVLSNHAIDLDPREARVLLRSREGVRPEGRWEWKKDSKELKEIVAWLNKQVAAAK